MLREIIYQNIILYHQKGCKSLIVLEEKLHLMAELHKTLLEIYDHSGGGKIVELQWLEHPWNHDNMFETGVVRASEF